MLAKSRVPDEYHCIKEKCANVERADPAVPEEEQREDHAHDRVADEPAEALVQVVGAAQQGARDDDRRQRPAQPGAAGSSGTRPRPPPRGRAFCAADSSSTGTAHQTSAGRWPATVVFSPRARAARYRPSPGMPMSSDQPGADTEVEAGPRRDGTRTSPRHRRSGRSGRSPAAPAPAPSRCRPAGTSRSSQWLVAWDGTSSTLCWDSGVVYDSRCRIVTSEYTALVPSPTPRAPAAPRSRWCAAT